jgi:C4-dicarboxylate-specific signal transduction histidine kinase
MKAKTVLLLGIMLLMATSVFAYSGYTHQHTQEMKKIHQQNKKLKKKLEEVKQVPDTLTEQAELQEQLDKNYEKIKGKATRE